MTGHLLQWFTDYLNNRKQRVVLPGVLSLWTDLKVGVPKDSILGTLLFLTYINDIVRNINSSIRLFADDTSLYIIVKIQSKQQLYKTLIFHKCTHGHQTGLLPLIHQRTSHYYSHENSLNHFIQPHT